MDFSYPPEAAAFREEFRAWLAANLPEGLVGLDWASTELDSDELERMRAWNRSLAEAGYAAIAWPEEYGGRGAGVMEQVVFAEEMSKADAPGTLNPLGISNIAPAIMQWGTAEQKRGFLPRMLRGDDIWCQGFSEPNAGSDLASLRTRAVLDGDTFVKHAGISCLLVDMTLPGVEVRPLVTITGEREFNEIFFDDVRVPRDALLGPLNEGWKVAMTTLAYERGGVAALHLRVRKKVQRLLELARTTNVDTGGRTAADVPAVRQALARVYLEAEYLKLLSDRAISGELHGRPLGPESSLAKLAWSDVENRIAEAAGEVLGPAANTGAWGRDRVYVRALSIAGGTTQVNKNIIAQRVLGLPRS